MDEEVGKEVWIKMWPSERLWRTSDGVSERGAEFGLEHPLLMGIMSFYRRPLSLPAMLSAARSSTQHVCV